jgi:hypothetical protein
MLDPIMKSIKLGYFLGIAGLIVLAAVYRVSIAGAESWFNTAPIMALAFAGSILMGPRFWWVPLLAFLGSEVVLLLVAQIPLGGYTLISLGVFFLVARLGGSLSPRAGTGILLGGTMLASLTHYVVLNTWSWAVSPLYAPTLAGWWQSQTIGIAGFPPSYLFLRNALVADLAWCALGLAVFLAVQAKMGREAFAQLRTEPVSTPVR